MSRKEHSGLRRRLYTAQDGLCAICGKGMTLIAVDAPNYVSLDRIVPLADGGDDLRENIQAACIDCNNRKGSKAGTRMELIAKEIRAQKKADTVARVAAQEAAQKKTKNAKQARAKKRAKAEQGRMNMSRIELPAAKKGYSIACGLDNPMQEWFFMLYAPEEVQKKLVDRGERSPDDDGPILWVDTRSQAEVLEHIKAHANMESTIVKKVVEAIALDLCPVEYWKSEGGLW